MKRFNKTRPVLSSAAIAATLTLGFAGLAAAQQGSAPVRQVPMPQESAPVQQAPMQQAPVQQAPVQQMPTQQAPVQQMPAQQAPMQQMPAQQGGANGAANGMNPSNGTVGGSSTDMSSAGNTNGGGMPQVQQQGGVEFVSGGVGLDESKALQAARSQWPLSLRFTDSNAEFLADVRVQIVDAQGASVLNATSRGPYMLVRVRPGRYTVHVSHNGVDKTSAVTVGSNGSARASFVW
ncbi:Carboxypeptidase regulatory-like domain-containing protein [Paraburkholderia sacchari]